MASGLIGNEVHRKVLRVRLPCPPLFEFRVFTQDSISCRLLPSCALFSRACCESAHEGGSTLLPPNSPRTAVYNDAFNDALVLGVGAVGSCVKLLLCEKKGWNEPLRFPPSALFSL